MKMYTTLYVLVFALLILASGVVLSQGVPSSFTYQGKVTDAADQPIPDGSHAMRFKLFDAETTGNQLWDSGDMNVGVRFGVFSIALGAAPTPPITSTTLSSDNVWLEVTIGLGPPLSRTKLSSAPFALRAADLALPFSKTVNTSENVFSIKNNGSGDTIYAENYGSGSAIYAQSLNGAAVFGLNSITGNTGVLAGSAGGVQGSASGSSYGVWGSMNGSGDGVLGTNKGTGYAGRFEISNASSSTAALYAKTSGTGPSAHFDGKVGIGVSLPNRSLYVAESATGLSYPLKLDNPHSSYGDATGILFSAGGDGGNNLSTQRGKGALVYEYKNTWNRGDFHFLQENGANTTNPTLSNKVFTITNGGNIGIRTSTPGFPLTFADTAGDKISLWGQSGNNFGLGIQTNLMQIHSYSSATDIAFGYGSSASMTETMRIKGSGQVGIGTSVPDAKLHVTGSSDKAIFGKASNSISTIGYGVYGEAGFNDGIGVYGANVTNSKSGSLGGATFGVKSNGDLLVENGDMVVTGAYRGTIGPNNGAPFPRPAYDSGWVAFDDGGWAYINHNVGLNTSNYVIDLQYRGNSLSMPNGYPGGYFQNLSKFTMTIERLSDLSLVSEVRVRIWVYN